MKLFKCQHCGQILYFENEKCERCGHRLGYLPETFRVWALEPEGDVWRPVGREGSAYRFCANAEHGACNWLIAADATSPFCTCCQHNRTIPDLSDNERLVAWRKLEQAKHRLFYSLMRLNLPLADNPAEPVRHLAFDFLADPPQADAGHVMTGHDNGLITIALAEADDAQRERNRTSLHEPYRTLLGHFRHEIGHYYWDRLVADGGHLDAFRAVFGDERADYGEALQRHYNEGPPADWQQSFVTTYATCHPWEDFAESWAHYLHIVDTLEIAAAFELSTHPSLVRGDALDARVDFDPYGASDAKTLVETWMPLSLALNSLNRAMGQPDLYPFVLSDGAIAKLGFIHDLIHGQLAATAAPEMPANIMPDMPVNTAPAPQ